MGLLACTSMPNIGKRTKHTEHDRECVFVCVCVCVCAYIYIYKDLLHRDLWKYMLGYKIVPTTNSQHYHFGYSCE